MSKMRMESIEMASKAKGDNKTYLYSIQPGLSQIGDGIPNRARAAGLWTARAIWADVSCVWRGQADGHLQVSPRQWKQVRYAENK